MLFKGSLFAIHISYKYFNDFHNYHLTLNLAVFCVNHDTFQVFTNNNIEL